MEIMRIVDKLNITGRGNVYILKCYGQPALKIHSSLYDLQGNRFELYGKKCSEEQPTAREWMTSVSASC